VKLIPFCYALNNKYVRGTEDERLRAPEGWNLDARIAKAEQNNHAAVCKCNQ
jgi:hypothetical protein